MKYKQLSFLVILLITLMSFNKNSNSYQTECISLETDGYISFKIWDTKQGKSYKIEQARKDAIHAVLYAGIAGSNGCSTQTALLDKSEDIDKFKKIENEFFSSKGKWAQYTRSSSIETTLPANLSVKNWKVYQVSVSKDALKKYLEEKSILKSINTGF
nr:hypothetical protein [uncultured Flavobacterium sp.]